AQGGPPQLVTDLNADVGIGFTTADDRVIYTGIFDLFQVPLAGGAEEPILKSLKVRPGFNPMTLLPDGVHFLYSALMSLGRVGAQTPGIYVGSLDPSGQGDSKQILRDNSNVQFVKTSDSDSGYVLFLRDGSLLAQSLDLRKLEVTGEPVTIAQGVSY